MARPEGTTPAPVSIAPEDGFNIIYSSGTTGIPKGIVQSHAMRWQHLSRNAAAGFDTAVTLLSTPLYSNTTLVTFLPTLAWGGWGVIPALFPLRGAFRQRARASTLPRRRRRGRGARRTPTTRARGSPSR